MSNSDTETSRVQLSTLRLENARLKAEIADRRESDVETYLEDISEQATLAQKPLAPSEIEDVRSLFSCGKDKLARRLGTALVNVALSQSEPKFRSKGTVELAEDEGSKQKKLTVENQIKMYRALGWTVETNEDKTEITRADPPKRRI